MSEQKKCPFVATYRGPAATLRVSRDGKEYLLQVALVIYDVEYVGGDKQFDLTVNLCVNTERVEPPTTKTG